MTTQTQNIQVVIAYDFSPSAEEALARAVEVACRAPQHVLHVLAAIDARHGMPIEPASKIDYDYAEKIQHKVTERMTAAFAGRTSASEVQFYIHARIGKPAEEVLRLAQEISADLLFVGSHGKTGVERFLLGSVSERVVREAKCPVMVVRPKTYAAVELEKVVKYEHDRTTYTAPHRYSYVDQRVTGRHNDVPFG